MDDRARKNKIRAHMASHPGTTYSAAARAVDAAHRPFHANDDLGDDALLHAARTESAWSQAAAAAQVLIDQAGNVPDDIDADQRHGIVLLLRLHLYFLTAGPEAATFPPRPDAVPDGTPRQLGGLLVQLGHDLTGAASADDPIAEAWQWLAERDAFTEARVGVDLVLSRAHSVNPDYWRREDRTES